MIQILVLTLLLALIKFYLAKKDADSYLLKGQDNANTIINVTRWHRDGVILDVLITGALAYTSKQYWQVPVLSLLLRFAIYNLIFNDFANLSITYIGTTASTDKLFTKIFGVNGAVKASIAFGVLLIAFVVSDIIFKF